MKSIIKQIREENGFTQDQLAIVLDTGRQTIFDLEHGHREKISDKFLNELELIGYDPELVARKYEQQRKAKKKDLIKKVK
jgi:DNA-binding XRE family transcriptional regulator